MRTLSTPVLIVGGAASGMGLANDLGYRGSECLVIDQGTGVINVPKTGHISARTMEHCRRWGFVDQVWHSGFPRDLPLDTVLCTSLTGYEISRKPTPSIEDTRSLPNSPENRVRCPQMIFDPLLAARYLMVVFNAAQPLEKDGPATAGLMQAYVRPALLGYFVE